jgi:hypothetical protein
MCEIFTDSQAPEVTAANVDSHHWRPQRIQFSFVLITYNR